jgi:hypothetical protein
MNPTGEARRSRAAPVKRRPWSLLGGAAIVISLVFFRLSFEQRSYAHGGITVQGVVTDKAYSPGTASSSNARSGSFATRFVMYRFTASDGRTHDGKTDVLPELWDSLRVGDPVAVEYLAESPDTNQIPDQRAGTRASLITGIATLLAGLALAGFGQWKKRASQEARSIDGEKER